MTKHKCPYTFPARSRAAMIDYILNGESHPGRSWNRDRQQGRYEGFFFHWSVKAHDVDWSHPKGEHKIDSAFDDAWDEYLEKNPEGPSLWAFEDAQRYYVEDDWTSWPGDDQGDWKFGFYGRQGGHLCLEQWRGYKFTGKDKSEIREYLEEMEPFSDLRKFYIGIVCADHDFTPAKASENVEFYVNDYRHQWEEERKEERESKLREIAESYEESRPDLYQGIY